MARTAVQILMTDSVQNSTPPTTQPTEKSVEGIVLAGTHYWTGSSFEELMPRPLLPVAQTPIIDYVLGWLQSGGITAMTICANGSTAPMRAYVGDGRDRQMRIRYQEDDSPRGAAGCVKDAAALSGAETLVVTDGTSIPVFDLHGLVEHHRRTGAVLTMAAHRRRARLGSEPLTHPAGVYVFERRVLEAVPATSFQDIKENLIPRLYRTGERIELFRIDEVSPRVMGADSYLAANRWMVARIVAAHRSSHSEREPAAELVAHPTASIDPDALIVGPTLLGPGVRVHAGATIVGPTSIGAETTVAKGAVVARSVTWKNCVVGERAILDHSLLADNAGVDADAFLSNAIRLASHSRAVRTPLSVHSSSPRGLEAVA